MAVNREDRKDPAKLPVQQLAILAICRFAEPVVLTSVYPYIPEMIESFGVPDDQTAKWAGIASAAFSVSQSMTAILWGHLSDRFGRKPAIITGLTCTMVFSMIWGFSKNLAMAITARSLQGAFNGNVGTIRTMVAEMVPQKELQPRAFSIMPLVWSLGSIFGPSFGGFFAKPAEHMPKLFGGSAFFIKFPFALPNILASALFMIGITTAILFLKETHHVKRDKKDLGLLLGKKIENLTRRVYRHSKFSKKSCQAKFTETSPLLSSRTSHTTVCASKSRSITLSEVFSWQTSLNLFTSAFLSMHSISYDQLLPIFMHNPPTVPSKPLGAFPIKFSGGFGLDSSRIGSLFTVCGILSCAAQFLIFPPVARRFGVLNCFKGCAILFPIIYFVTPYMALIKSSFHQQICMLIVMIFKSVATIFAFPCSLILLTNSARSLNILGTLNGFAVSISAIGRAIGPALCGLTFTWGMENNYTITPWWLLSVIAIVGAVPIWWMIECEGFAESDVRETTTSSGRITQMDGNTREWSGSEESNDAVVEVSPNQRNETKRSG